jgi:hypothetical protein
MGLDDIRTSDSKYEGIFPNLNRFLIYYPNVRKLWIYNYTNFVDIINRIFLLSSNKLEYRRFSQIQKMIFKKENSENSILQMSKDNCKFALLIKGKIEV